MAQVRTVNITWNTVFTTGTANQVCFHPMTSWMPAAQLAAARASYEARCADANCEMRPVVQMADEVDGPFTEFKAVGGVAEGWTAGDGIVYPTDGFAILAADSAKKQIARLGFETRLKTGGTVPAFARPTAKLEIQTCGG